MPYFSCRIQGRTEEHLGKSSEKNAKKKKNQLVFTVPKINQSVQDLRRFDNTEEPVAKRPKFEESASLAAHQYRDSEGSNGIMSQEKQNVEEKPSDYYDRYSRQHYVLGEAAMNRMAKSNVFISGLGGVGVEIGA